MDENGTGCVGCGPQEQFRGCADVAIGDDFTHEELIPEHEYTPVTIVTNKQNPLWTRTNENYIDYKDAVNSVKNNRNYRRKWWKDKEQDNKEDDDSDAKILFATLFQNRTESHLLHGPTSEIYIYISTAVLLLLYLWWREVGKIGQSYVVASVWKTPNHGHNFMNHISCAIRN